MDQSTHFYPRLSLTWLVSLILILAIFSGGYFWYNHLPKPILITAEITPPLITPNEDILIPQPLRIDFGIMESYGFMPSSVAPLEKIGKIVMGIEISPNIPGKWVWQNDYILIFTPEDDWPAGQSYKINFDKKVFANHIQLASYQYSFSTHPFEIDVSDFKFYQDLKNPLLKRIVATLNFNYPVEPSCLEQHTHLILQAIKNNRLNLASQKFPLTISYGNHYRSAYIQSEPITLPPITRYVNLVIEKGIQAAKGPSKTNTDITQKVLIPDKESFLKIKKVKARIERNNNDQPEQVLVIETTAGVNIEDLEKHFKVYQLPLDCPANLFEEEKKEYEWNNPGEITADIIALSSPIQLHPFHEEHPFPTLHRFKFKAESPSHLFIKIDKGMPGYGGFILGHDYATIEKTPSYPQEIHFLRKGSLIASSSDKKLTVSVRGVSEVKFSISRVLAHNINHLITQTCGKFQTPEFYNSQFSPEDICQTSFEFKKFNSNSNELQYATLDLEEYLEKSQHPLGLFLLKVQGWNRKYNCPTEAEEERLVLITDMGLLIKDNADNSHDIFVQSITEGSPVANAHVEIIGKNGLPILNSETDEEGHAFFSSVEAFKNESTPTAYLVRKGNDISFIPYQRSDRQLNCSRFDIGGIQDLSNANLSAFIFTDRGVYRPGEVVHMGIIVKNSFMHDLTPGLPLEIIIYDSLGHKVIDQKIKLPESNFFTFDFCPAVSSPTGTYDTHLYLVKEQNSNHILGSNSIRVEEFLPDHQKIDLHFITGDKLLNHDFAWISPDDLKAKIKISNLFGMPADNHRIESKITIEPGTLFFSKFADYHFAKTIKGETESNKFFTESLPETFTDTNGDAELNLNLDRFAQSIYRLSLLVEGFEADGGRCVSTNASILVAPVDYLIGYKSDGDLSYLKQNCQHKVHFLAIDSSLNPLNISELEGRLYEITTVSTLVKKADETYQYQTAKKELLLSANSFIIDKIGSNFSLPTEKCGDFALALSDSNGNLVSKLYFSVIGESKNSDLKDAELSIKLDKKIYRPGDEIAMQITGPYAGSGLITIEREKVLAYKWFKTDSTTTYETIKIPSNFEGNGYINVAFVRSWDSDEIFINPLCHAIVPFNISYEEQTVHIDLKVPELVRPGSMLPIQFSTDKPAKIVLSAVDEGILQVSNYPTPDPLAHFFCKRALMVKTFQIVDLILPKYVGSREFSSTGGDDRAKLLAMNLNPFKQKNEQPAVFWSDIIDSDAMPKIVNYLVPDNFNGSLRIMAIAVAPNSAGTAEQNTKVQAHFVIHPHAPQFVVPDDIFTASASITNCSADIDSHQTITISLETSPHLSIIGPHQQSIEVPHGQRCNISFQLKTNHEFGSAKLIFTAGKGDIQSQTTASVNVRPHSAFQTKIITGFDDALSKSIDIHEQLYPEYRLLQGTASSNPLILVKGLHDYLKSYPHDCTEQLISKAFINLTMASHPLFPSSPESALNEFKHAIHLLRQRQTCNGSFCYWPWGGDPFSSKMATVYAMDYLTEAKLAGYPVPADVFNAGMLYLQSYAKEDFESLLEGRLQAYTIYLLTRNGLITSNYLTNLQLNLLEKENEAWQEDIASAYLAATHQLLQNHEEAARLIKGYSKKKLVPTKSCSIYNSLVCDAQYIFLLAKHFPNYSDKIGSKLILELAQSLHSYQLNTLSAAYTAKALMACAQSKTDNENQIIVTEVLQDNSEVKLPFSSQSCPTFVFGEEAKQIRFQNPARQNFFYQIIQSGFDKTCPEKPIKNGLEVFREYRDSQGKKTQTALAGDKISVHVFGRALNAQYIDNIAILDLLPGGFEVIPNSLMHAGCDYVDIREDRIIFYCSLSQSASEFSYQLRAINKGSYTIPPIFAQAMYRQDIQSQDTTGNFSIK